jgi:hypothetical protein
MGQLCCSIYIYVLMKPFPSRPCALRPPHFLSGRVSAANEGFISGAECRNCLCVYVSSPPRTAQQFFYIPPLRGTQQLRSGCHWPIWKYCGLPLPKQKSSIMSYFVTLFCISKLIAHYFPYS